MDLIAILGLLLLAALNILQLVFGYRERRRLYDRIQARSLNEYKHFEAQEQKRPDEKTNTEPVEYV